MYSVKKYMYKPWPYKIVLLSWIICYLLCELRVLIMFSSKHFAVATFLVNVYIFNELGGVR